MNGRKMQAMFTGHMKHSGGTERCHEKILKNGGCASCNSSRCLSFI